MTNALFLGTLEDANYVPHLKGMFGGVTTYVVTEKVTLLFQLESYCAKRSITKVVSTNTDILAKLLALRGNDKISPSLSDYAGSLFQHKGLEIVFISPLPQLFTVPYGKFIAKRFVSKLIDPSSWREPSPFKWDLLTASNIDSYYARFLDAFAIAIDIETFKENLAIRCVGWTGVFIGADGSISTESLVLPLTSDWALAWVRKFNQIPVRKIFQNGPYDNAYLLRYNAYPTDWYWDTAILFHAYYSELPKDLAFLNAFFLRSVVYWKDLAETKDLEQYYRYNAMDTWATANVWINQVLQMPDWAQRNYALEFPLVYPCLLAEMTGVIRDGSALEKARKEIDGQIEQKTTSLEKSLGVPGFNPGSPPQVKKLLAVFGCADITSTKEIFLQQAAYRHPLIGRIVDLILDIRGIRKLKTTYLRSDEDAKQSGIHAGEGGAKEFKDTWLYTQKPHGTDSGRLASGEHHFWCGANIQNVPVRDGPIVRQTIRASEGFYFGECDLEQAETRDTAHITGDEVMIKNVSGEDDFHSLNVVAMTGKTYEEIYDREKKKTKNKKLRDIFKRVNHGANYNLVDTMGLKMAWETKQILNLSFNEPRKITGYLLEKFHATYTKLRGPKAPYSEGSYYAYVVKEITVHRKLISRAFHHTEYNERNYKAYEYIEQGDWTRYCFGRPDTSKSDLNAYVSHGPQSLNARTLNEAWMQVFYDIALPNPETFRLHAQIHDSIFFSYAKGHQGLASRVRERMEIPVTVRDISGTYRTFTVPAALKIGKEGHPAKYWSETE
jgi:hypothetical protein